MKQKLHYLLLIIVLAFSTNMVLAQLDINGNEQ